MYIVQHTQVVFLRWNHKWHLGYLKASNNWGNNQPHDLVYKKQEWVFSLKGSEIKVTPGNPAIPALPTAENNSYDYKHFDYKDHLHSTVTV
jgi:hypothetical protein